MFPTAAKAKIIIFTVLLIFVVLPADAQKKFGIKLYQNTDLFEKKYDRWIDNDWADKQTVVSYVNLNRFTLALDFETKNGLSHELEFMIPEISKSFNDVLYPFDYEFRRHGAFNGQVSTYSFRYEIRKTLTKEPRRFAFDLGLGLNPYYVFEEYIPKIETFYYQSDKSYGVALNITPGMKYKISNRFSMELDAPLRCFDLRWEKFRIKNPSIPIRQQTAEEISHHFFVNAYTIRLGLRYALNPGNK